MIEYKGYTGVFEYDEEYEFFSGHVIDTRDGINFEGRSVMELKESMRRAVDDYLEFCEEKGRAPSKPYSGRVLLRIDPELHRRLAAKASSQRMSMNAYVAERLGEIAP
ncbi:type II toxin-antitoxin system HicB family antitoxin [Candidatus Palauibacter sp.]|uniref:type II toxin-antitoxin system HicB family antitoxin n=1 Tax=Candidatus Palauibacter sp. TaxID=3101350 RepID=UPI003B015EA0